MPQTSKPAPKLRELLYAIIRTKHYSLRTENTYWYWIHYLYTSIGFVPPPTWPKLKYHERWLWFEVAL